eukprot:m.63238 g.63238  ORF g.63238 m.63238 type:complete len:57 (+) comp17766_c0_seq2:55-225(+)
MCACACLIPKVCTTAASVVVATSVTQAERSTMQDSYYSVTFRSVPSRSRNCMGMCT